MSEKHVPHLVVVGAGFGGLQLIHDLRNVEIRIR
jgi:NADH dehydrogenase